MCTCFKVKAQDNSIVIGRTMEFGVDLKSGLTVFPRGFKFTGTGVGGKPGYSWQGKYGFVGMNAMGLPMVSDGLNEKGLYVGDLLIPGFIEYQVVPAGSENKSVSQLDVAGLILSTCSTVEDAKEVMKSVFVWPYPIPQMQNNVLPLHFSIHDAEGSSAVFEYVGGELKIHDNPVGVLTNSPNFDWHLTNLRNYVNLSANNVPELKLVGDDVKPIGQGSGMLGLPGDSTPPSRFIRAVALTQSALKVANGEEATNLTYHILNNFDIPKGFARDVEGSQTFYDYTSWLVMADITNKIYYYRSYTNLKYYRVDLAKVDFSGETMKTIDTSNSLWFQEVS